MDQPKPAVSPTKRARRRRKLLWISGSLAAFLLIFYLIITSSAFIRGVVLPRIGKSLNASITADEVGLSPFSQLYLRGFKLQTTGSEPLLQAAEARVHYSLWSLLAGRLNAAQIKLSSPTVVVVQNADGTSNLDPLMKSMSAKPSPPSTKTPKPSQIDLRDIVLNQGVLRWKQTALNGDRQSAELSNLNLNIDRMQNGQAGKVTLAAELKCELNQAASASTPASNSVFQAKVAGSYNYKFTADLLPQTVSGAIRLSATQAQGIWSDFAALNAVLECELTPTEIQKLALRFERNGLTLGQLSIDHSHIDLAKNEARLTLKMDPIDRQVLNLFGAAHGLDFAQTTLTSSNLVDISQQGKSIIVGGRFDAHQFSLSRQAQTSPAMDLGLDYEITLDLAGRSLWLRQLGVTGKQGTNEILRAALDKPMNISWGNTSPAVMKSTFQWSVTNLNLADWGFLAGDTAPAGRLNLTGQIVADKSGRQFTAELNTLIRNLSARIVANGATNTVNLAQFEGQLKGRLDDFQKFNAELQGLEITDQNQSLVSGNGSFNYDRSSGDYRLRTSLEAYLPGVLQKFPIPRFVAQSGKLGFTSLLTREKQNQSLNGKVTLSDFSGLYKFFFQFQKYQADLKYDLQINDQQVKINQARFSALQNTDSGGTFNLSGAYNLAKNSGQFTFAMTDFNQNAFGPVSAPA